MDTHYYFKSEGDEMIAIPTIVQSCTKKHVKWTTYVDSLQRQSLSCIATHTLEYDDDGNAIYIVNTVNAYDYAEKKYIKHGKVLLQRHDGSFELQKAFDTTLFTIKENVQMFKSDKLSFIIPKKVSSCSSSYVEWMSIEGQEYTTHKIEIENLRGAIYTRETMQPGGDGNTSFVDEYKGDVLLQLPSQNDDLVIRNVLIKTYFEILQPNYKNGAPDDPTQHNGWGKKNVFLPTNKRVVFHGQSRQRIVYKHNKKQFVRVNGEYKSFSKKDVATLSTRT